MRFLFYLGHPAHYHNVSRVTDKLKALGHESVLVARKKDVLLRLLETSPHRTLVIERRDPPSTQLSRVAAILRREHRMLRIALRERPDVMIGTDIVITHVGRILGIPSIVMSEDDSPVVPQFVRYGYRFASTVLAPAACDTSPYQHKTVRYPGNHELGYLRPGCFTPDPARVADLRRGEGRYFILRLTRLTAYHDVGKRGIDVGTVAELIRMLSPHGAVHISAERPLEPELEPFRIAIDPVDIHHALAFASMYIGDSQTMAAEAAVLGTPSLRFNDFIGQLGILEELEHRWGLTKGIGLDHPEELLATVREWLADEDLPAKWRERRERMLQETVDVAEFLTWFFAGYPETQEALADDPGLMERFR